tara:strand:- start:1035 stop:1904 length:870 start_codon:yes stop_codon:yes gene_type:complete
MSNELAITTDLGMSMAEAIGVSSSAGETKSASLTRINLTHNAIMGSMDVGGKKVKTEVVPAGAYKLTLGEDNEVYSVNPSVRIFAVRQQWSKWDSESNQMQKTVMSTDLKGDLKDNMGGFNLGRPSGYIEDWDAVPQKTKDLIRSIKRKKIVFGMLTASDLTDAEGNAVESITEPMPFVYEVSPSSIKALDQAMSSLIRKNILAIQYTFTLGADEGTLPNGNTYAIMTLGAGDKVDITQEDQTKLKDFMDYIEYNNSYILNQWEEKHKEGISGEDADVVASFVNVEEAD